MKAYVQKRIALIFAASLGLAGCATHQDTTMQTQPVEYTEHQKCKWACCKCAHCMHKHHKHHHMHKHHKHHHHMQSYCSRHSASGMMMENQAPQQGTVAPMSQ